MSEEGGARIEEEKPPAENKRETVKEPSSKCENSVNIPSKESNVNNRKTVESAESNKQVLSTDSKLPQSANHSRETTPGKEKTPPSQPGSGKKPRRRLAANFSNN